MTLQAAGPCETVDQAAEARLVVFLFRSHVGMLVAWQLSSTQGCFVGGISSQLKLTDMAVTDVMLFLVLLSQGLYLTQLLQVDYFKLSHFLPYIVRGLATTGLAPFPGFCLS